MWQKVGKRWNNNFEVLTEFLFRLQDFRQDFSRQQNEAQNVEAGELWSETGEAFGTFEAFGTWGSKMNEFHVVFEAAK